jgi:hypothetical protein
MAPVCNLIYRTERIGQVDVTRLALLFMLVNLRTHPDRPVLGLILDLLLDALEDSNGNGMVIHVV